MVRYIITSGVLEKVKNPDSGHPLLGENQGFIKITHPPKYTNHIYFSKACVHECFAFMYECAHVMPMDGVSHHVGAVN